MPLFHSLSCLCSNTHACGVANGVCCLSSLSCQNRFRQQESLSLFGCTWNWWPTCLSNCCLNHQIACCTAMICCVCGVGHNPTAYSGAFTSQKWSQVNACFLFSGLVVSYHLLSSLPSFHQKCLITSQQSQYLQGEAPHLKVGSWSIL